MGGYAKAERFSPAVSADGRLPARFTQSGSGANVSEVAFVLALGLVGLAAVNLFRADKPLLAAVVMGAPLAAACLLQPRVGVYAYGFWQAWDSAVKFGGGLEPGWITVAKLLGLLVVTTGTLHVLVSPQRLVAARRPFAYLFGLCVVATTSVVWSYDPAGSIRFAGQMWLQLALVWVFVILVGFDRSRMTRLIWWIVVGALSASIYVLLFGMEQRAYLRATLGEQANPVSVAAALVTGLTCVPALWVLVSSRAMKVSLVPVGLVILLAIFATGTRAAVVAVGAGFLSMGIFSRGRALWSRLGLLLASILLVVVGTFAALNAGVLGAQSESRLRKMLMLDTRDWDPDVGVQQGSRTDIWRMSLGSYTRTHFIGTGVGASPAANAKLGGWYKDVHSSILASLTELGPLGLAVFAALHVSLFLRIRGLKTKGLQAASLMILVGFVLIESTHTTYTTKWFWLPVTLLLAILELDARQVPAGAPQRGRPA